VLVLRARSQLSYILSMCGPVPDRPEHRPCGRQRRRARKHNGARSPGWTLVRQLWIQRRQNQVSSVPFPSWLANYTPNLTPWNAAVGTEYRAPLVNDLKWYGRIDGQLYGCDRYLRPGRDRFAGPAGRLGSLDRASLDLVRTSDRATHARTVVRRSVRTILGR